MPIFPGFEPVFAPIPGMLEPSDEAELRDIIERAIVEETALNIVGHGSKSALGQPPAGAVNVSLHKLSGIIDYAPSELVLTAYAATPLAEIDKALKENGQHLAFEPPFFDHLQNQLKGKKSKAVGTIGGVLATNLSGPRRFSAGAARDHFLGVRAISGRAECFKSGGRVVKNVTGYDMCKLLTGSFGTLAIMTEVTVKVLPAPDEIRTVMITGLEEAIAVDVMLTAAQRADPITGAAHLPTVYSVRSQSKEVNSAQQAVTLLRLEGTGASITKRTAACKEDFSGYGEVSILDHEVSKNLWAEIRDMTLESAEQERALWRISVPATKAANVLATLRQHAAGSDGYYDWAGGMIIYAVPPDHMDTSKIISTVAEAGGHAMLIRRPDAVELAYAYQTLEPGLAALNNRIKENFDPKNILNPKRFENREHGL